MDHDLADVVNAKAKELLQVCIQDYRDRNNITTQQDTYDVEFHFEVLSFEDEQLEYIAMTVAPDRMVRFMYGAGDLEFNLGLFSEVGEFYVKAYERLIQLNDVKLLVENGFDGDLHTRAINPAEFEEFELVVTELDDNDTPHMLVREKIGGDSIVSRFPWVTEEYDYVPGDHLYIRVEVDRKALIVRKVGRDEE